MPIVFRYLTIQITKYFGIVLAFVIGIYIAVDFFEKIDDFMEAGLQLSKVLTFFIVKTPFILAQMIPVCLLLAVLIVFGLMTRNNEILALKSSGVRIYYLLKPVLVIGFLSSVLLFLLSEMIVPITTAKANQIWLREVRKESAVISKEKNIWIKGNKMITHIAYYNPVEKTIFEVTLNWFDEKFRLIRRVDARKGAFRQKNWVLHDIIEQNLDDDSGNYDVTLHKERIEKLGFLPEDLKRVVKKSEEMTYIELSEYIKKVEAEGYNASIYKVDLYSKTAFPFVCIILCMVGTGIAVRGKIKEGLALGIAYGIGVAFFYWVLYSFCISLGYGEMLPPGIAAWAANLIFFCFGALTLINAE
jgi:lipopolysaccharide export system permease protein